MRKARLSNNFAPAAYRARFSFLGKQLLALLIISSTLCFAVQAQPPGNGPTAPGRPGTEKQPIQAIAQQLSKLFGKDFSLKTAEQGGKLGYKISEETGELQYFLAEKEVSIRSDKFDLDCDKLEFTSAAQKLIATGQPVVVRKDGLQGECQQLDYFLEYRRLEMTKNPAIFNIDEEGNKVITRAKKILIEEDDQGNTYLLFEDSASITYQAKESPKSESEAVLPRKAQKIDEKTVDKIWEPKISE